MAKTVIMPNTSASTMRRWLGSRVVSRPVGKRTEVEAKARMASMEPMAAWPMSRVVAYSGKKLTMAASNIKMMSR